MELNPKHEVFDKILDRYLADADDQTLNNYAELLLGYALIAEGSGLHDPVRFNSLVMNLMAENLCIACSGHETGAVRTSYT